MPHPAAFALTFFFAASVALSAPTSNNGVNCSSFTAQGINDTMSSPSCGNFTVDTFDNSTTATAASTSPVALPSTTTATASTTSSAALPSTTATASISPVAPPTSPMVPIHSGTDSSDDHAADDRNKTSSNSSAASETQHMSGLTVVVQDAESFCLFLPSSPGNRDENGGKDDPNAVSESEKSARTFCTTPSSMNAVPDAWPMPEGFIQSSKFASNGTRFVQVTGSIDRSAYALSPEDGGGQYDNHGAGSPPQSQCAGYPYFVSLIEPDINHFCIRCCNYYTDCHAGRSAYGCQRVVPEISDSSDDSL